ncbi:MULTISPECIES: hypothetical protein [Paenibacillus]|uniref:Uncharacterized protein n=1 Tax=Paenibacillus xylanilyticus TaxID=248903 RepID=A0A7Y6EVY9_9BACL|nr:hypothetical protein [Paenibacillus xylanilyticus]NUU75925.1 hypothetical protein [Paenibacillus xylanilyticus]
MGKPEIRPAQEVGGLQFGNAVRCDISIIGTSLHAAFMPALDTGAYPYAPNWGFRGCRISVARPPRPSIRMTC